MRNDWTDDRLDAFSRETYRRFDELDRRLDLQFGELGRRFEEVDRRLDRQFGEVNRRVDEVNERLSELNSRFDGLQDAVFALHRMMFRASVGVILALIGILATQL